MITKTTLGLIWMTQDNFEAALEALRRDFLKKAQAKCEEMQRILDGADEMLPSADYGRLIVLAHQLAGSGGTFDAPGISTSARILEQHLKACEAGSATGRQETHALLAALQEQCRHYLQEDGAP